MNPRLIGLMDSSRDGCTHPGRRRPLESRRELGGNDLSLRDLITNDPPAAAR